MHWSHERSSANCLRLSSSSSLPLSSMPCPQFEPGPTRLSITLDVVRIRTRVYPHAWTETHRDTWLSTRLSTCACTCVSTCMSTSRSPCLSTCLSTCLDTCLNAWQAHAYAKSTALDTCRGTCSDAYTHACVRWSTLSTALLSPSIVRINSLLQACPRNATPGGDAEAFFERGEDTECPLTAWSSTLSCARVSMPLPRPVAVSALSCLSRPAGCPPVALVLNFLNEASAAKEDCAFGLHQCADSQ